MKWDKELLQRPADYCSQKRKVIRLNYKEKNSFFFQEKKPCWTRIAQISFSENVRIKSNQSFFNDSWIFLCQVEIAACSFGVI